MSLSPLGNHGRYVLPRHLQGSRLKLVNTLGLAKVWIEWQEVTGMMYYIRIEMLSFQIPFGNPSRPNLLMKLLSTLKLKLQ